MKTARGHCPLCGSAQFAVEFDAQGRRVKARCYYNRCNPRAIMAALRGTALNQLQQTASDKLQDAARNRVTAQRIWEHAHELPNTPADRYLKSRGITIKPGACLRFHPNVFHHREPTHDVYHPAMVACAETSDGKFAGIHRTWIDPTTANFKLTITPQKASLGAGDGSIVRLSPYLTSTIVLTEGIEDGLSILQATGQSVWVTLGTAGFYSVRLPPCVHTVIIAGDNDPAGRKAINAAARRFYEECRQVRIIRPPAGFKDFNDALRAT